MVLSTNCISRCFPLIGQGSTNGSLCHALVVLRPKGLVKVVYKNEFRVLDSPIRSSLEGGVVLTDTVRANQSVLPVDLKLHLVLLNAVVVLSFHVRMSIFLPVFVLETENEEVSGLRQIRYLGVLVKFETRLRQRFVLYKLGYGLHEALHFRSALESLLKIE